MNHSIASTAHLKTTLSSINSSKPQEDNTERYHPTEEYNTTPINNNKHTTSIQVHRQDNTLNNIKSKYNTFISTKFKNNFLEKPNVKNVITLQNTVSTYNYVTSVASMKTTSVIKTVSNDILTFKNISSPLKLPTVYSETDNSSNKSAHLNTRKQTNALITTNNVNFTDKKVDHDSTFSTIADSTPKFLPPPPSQLKLQSLKMPSLPREHKHIYDGKESRSYKQNPEYVGDEDGWRNEAVLSNINTASVIHSSTINKLKVKCLKKRKKQSVSPSSSSDSNQLTSSLMAPSNDQMTRQQLALLAAATAKSHSKMHSSASSSTGTLTAGSGSMGRSFESGMKPAYSESSTLVDEEGEDLSPLSHLPSHPHTSHSPIVKSPELSELKFDVVKNKIYHETKDITTKEDQQHTQHMSYNQKYTDNNNNNNTYNHTDNLTENYNENNTGNNSENHTCIHTDKHTENNIDKHTDNNTDKHTDNNTDKHTDKQPDDDLCLLLKELSLHQFQSLFDQHEVDMETFMELTESNLEELGIMQEHSRKILLQSIKRIKEQSTGL